MRKYIPIAAALAVVVLLGAAIMASGEVLSFSVPGAGDSVVERAPSGQVEPQDYYGEATRAFYFGPDFMCLIYGDTTTIECFGSDADGVVSSAPTNTGFSFIDGGETYACAYNRGENFHYCWGSITLRPRTTQPTATATSVPTATATTLPPGVTPEPTATVEATATAGPVIDACHISFPPAFVLPSTLSGSWNTECVIPDGVIDNVAAGDRYYRWTSFAVSSAHGSWVADLTSEQDTVLILSVWNTETERWEFVEQNDDVVRGNTNSRIEWTPVIGRAYALSITTYTARTLGDFELTISASTASSQGQGSMEGQSMNPSDLQGAPFERRQ